MIADAGSEAAGQAGNGTDATAGAGATGAAAAAAAGATPGATATAGTSSAAPAAADAGKGGFLDGGEEGGTGTGADVDAGRLDAFAKAEGADARREAWGKLNDAEKAKAGEGLTDEERKALGVEDKTDGAVTYQDFKLPDGVKVDDGLMGKAKDTFAKAGLSQEQAQAVIDLYAGDVHGAIKQAAEQPYQLWRDTQNQWIEQVHKDPELGGANLQQAKANAARAIDMLCTTADERKALRAALTFTGATNHPDIVRFFARVGAKVSEGSFVAGKGATPAPKAPHEVMYGTTVRAVE